MITSALIQIIIHVLFANFAFANGHCQIQEKNLQESQDFEVVSKRLDVTTSDGNIIVFFGWEHGRAHSALPKILADTKKAFEKGTARCDLVQGYLESATRDLMTRHTYTDGRAIIDQIVQLNGTHRIDAVNLEATYDSPILEYLTTAINDMQFIRNQCPPIVSSEVIFQPHAVETHILFPGFSLIDNHNFNPTIRQIEDENLVRRFNEADNRLYYSIKDFERLGLTISLLSRLNIMQRLHARNKFSQSEISQVLAGNNLSARRAIENVMSDFNRQIDAINARDEHFIQSMRSEKNSNQVFIVGSAHIVGLRRILDRVCKQGDFYNP